MRLNHVVAGSLMVLMVGALSACSSTQNKTMSETQPGNMQDGVNYQATADQNTANMTPEENKSALQNLQTGQPTSYYTSEFNRLGFSVANSHIMNDQNTYDLRKGQERYMVTLTTPENQNQVNRVTVQELRSVANSDNTNPNDKNATSQEVASITKEIQSLQPGKKPYEYIPVIASKFGDVTEYSTNDQKAELQFENNKNHYYQVHFTLDPNTQKVTAIKLDRNVWSTL